MVSGPITSWQIGRDKMETVTDFIFLGLRKSLWMVTAAMKFLILAPRKKIYDKPRQYIEK